jgi:O-antigen ligase
MPENQFEFLMESESANKTNYFLRKDSWNIFGFYALCLTLFLMPFPRSFSLWTLGVFFLCGLMSWITDPGSTIKTFVHYLVIWLPPVLYFMLYLIRFFTGGSNWEYVEDKLMFLLVPLFGLPIFASVFFRTNLKILFLSLFFGIVIICVYQFTRATLESLTFTNGSLVFEPRTSNGVSRYLSEQFSTFEHPSYLAIKTLFVIAIILWAGKLEGFRRVQSFFLIVLLSLFVYFLAAKTELIILIILILLFLIKYLVTVIPRFPAILAIIVILCALSWIFLQNSRVKDKIHELKNTMSQGKTDWRNFDPRTRSWFYTIDLIKEKPFLGVGLNARNILAEEYRKNGYEVGADLRLNSHNQYLETQLTHGIPGSITLFWMLLTLIYFRKKTWNPELAGAFLIIISVSMLTESILVRQWGIMFYIIFYCVLLIPGSKIGENYFRVTGNQ